jgi:hypothetical protein
MVLGGCGGGGDSGGGGGATPAPTAQASADQTVPVGTPTTLDGSASDSPSGAPLSYQWTLTTKPAGSTASLTNPNSVRSTFTPDVAGTYTGTLVVRANGVDSQPDAVTLTAVTGNVAPIANAGPDRSAAPSGAITLDGSASRDPNKTTITYTWRIVEQPPGSHPTLTNATSAKPTFTADEPGRYVLALTCSDGSMTSTVDQVVIIVATGNLPPLANAGPDQTVTAGQQVTLDGTRSSDPNGDPLTYSWCVKGRPEGSTATLSAANVARPTFTPDVAGSYVFCLTVNDGKLGSDPDTVVVEARPAPNRAGRFNGGVWAIVAAQDGSGDVYVAGNFSTYNDRPVRPVVRLRANGSLNETFLLADSIRPSSDGDLTIAVADDGSGDLYVGAEVAIDPLASAPFDTRAGKVWKVNPDGTIDPAFIMGELRWSVAMQPMELNTITPVGDGSGRVYVAGVFDRYNGVPARGLIRLNPSGTMDTTFALALEIGGEVWHVVPLGDSTGRIYVTGISGETFGAQTLFRLFPDGTRDPAFNAGSGPRDQAAIFAVVLVGDGSGDLFVGGAFDNQLFTSSANPGRFLVRLNPDGSRDLSSPTPAITSSATFNSDDTVSLLAKATDGSGDLFVVQGGGSRLRRYKPTGLLDPQFQIGQSNGTATALLPTPDSTGDVYLGGFFSSYNGVPVGNIVRIHRDGTLAN